MSYRSAVDPLNRRQLTVTTKRSVAFSRSLSANPVPIVIIPIPFSYFIPSVFTDVSVYEFHERDVRAATAAVNCALLGASK